MGFESTYLWEDPIQSGVIFGSVFASLISICYYSLISVCAYGSLTALLAVLSLKVYTYVMVTFLKKEVPCNPLAKVAGKSKKTFNFFKYLGEKYHMYVHMSVLLCSSWVGYTNHEFTNPKNFSRNWMLVFTLIQWVQETLKLFFLTHIQLCVPTPIFRMSKVLRDGST